MLRLVIDAGYDDYLKENFANYRPRLEDLEQLAIFAYQFNSVEDFLTQLALLTNVEAEDDQAANRDAEQIKLSTIHQAKGLEFDAVFVIMLCDGLFPSERSLNVRRRRGRGAPAVLRGHHPREERALPDLPADPRQLWQFRRRRDATSLAVFVGNSRRPVEPMESAVALLNRFIPLRCGRCGLVSRAYSPTWKPIPKTSSTMNSTVRADGSSGTFWETAVAPASEDRMISAGSNKAMDKIAPSNPPTAKAIHGWLHLRHEAPPAPMWTDSIRRQKTRRRR